MVAKSRKIDILRESIDYRVYKSASSRRPSVSESKTRAASALLCVLSVSADKFLLLPGGTSHVRAARAICARFDIGSASQRKLGMVAEYLCMARRARRQLLYITSCIVSSDTKITRTKTEGCLYERGSANHTHDPCKHRLTPNRQTEKERVVQQTPVGEGRGSAVGLRPSGRLWVLARALRIWTSSRSDWSALVRPCIAVSPRCQCICQ